MNRCLDFHGVQPDLLPDLHQELVQVPTKEVVLLLLCHEFATRSRSLQGR